MVSGNAIDEQRTDLFNRIVHQTHLKPVDKKEPALATSSSTYVPAPVAQGADDPDSDRDPNDFVPAASSSRPNVTVAHDPYASDDDDYYF